ncbi:QRFP-like peptide receptor [Tachypleus tridentatus]|uniref:QRFP-like peptide receptor n=1 Tax=Tachypleus tridentatus TaxID=6853 RepID=UPI003FD146BF
MEQKTLKLKYEIFVNYTNTSYYNETYGTNNIYFYEAGDRENASITSWQDTLKELKDKLYKTNDVSVMVLISLYGILFLTGLAGNSIIAYFVCKQKTYPHGHRRNNMLINLCIADLMVILVCCPMAIYTSMTTVWHLGESLCKILTYLQGVSVTAGTLSMTALSLDRYVSVRHPGTFLKVNRHRMNSMMIAVVWTISVLFSLPIIFVRKMETLRVPSLQVSFCIEKWDSSIKRTFTIATLTVVHALPCLILLICQASVSRTIKSAEDAVLNRNDIRQRSFRMSSRNPNTPPPTREDTSTHCRRYIGDLCSREIDIRLQNLRVAKEMSSVNGSCSLQSTDREGVVRPHSPRMKRRLAYLLMGMTMCFVICWLPYNITSSYVDLFGIPSVAKYLPFTLLLGHAHSAINPIVYWLLNKTLRKKMHNIKQRSTSRPRTRHQRIPMKCFVQNTQSQFSDTTTENALGIFHPKYSKRNDREII